MPLPFDTPLENETDKAYAAFCAYRDLPPHERSIDAAYILLKYPKSTVKRTAAKNWYLWSVEFSWVERARSSDVYKDRLFRQAREQDVIRAQKEVLERGVNAAIEIIKAGERLLKMPPVKVTKKSDDGKDITYMPANASYIAQGAKMMLDGMKELRLCGMMSGEIKTLELTGREGLWQDLVELIQSGAMNVQQAKETIADESLAEEFVGYMQKKGVTVDV